MLLENKKQCLFKIKKLVIQKYIDKASKEINFYKIEYYNI